VIWKLSLKSLIWTLGLPICISTGRNLPIGLYTGEGRPRKNSEEIARKSAEESTGDGESQQSLDNLSVEELTGEDVDGEPAATDIGEIDNIDTDEVDPEETLPVTDSASDNIGQL
jgi:hypothetical protein